MGAMELVEPVNVSVRPSSYEADCVTPFCSSHPSCSWSNRSRTCGSL